MQRSEVRPQLHDNILYITNTPDLTVTGAEGGGVGVRISAEEAEMIGTLVIPEGETVEYGYVFFLFMMHALWQ